jgi:hypothetical protein
MSEQQTNRMFNYDEISMLNHYKVILENNLVEAVEKYLSHLLNYTDDEKDVLFDLWKNLKLYEVWIKQNPNATNEEKMKAHNKKRIIRTEMIEIKCDLDDLFEQNNKIVGFKNLILEVDQRIYKLEDEQRELDDDNLRHEEEREAGDKAWCNIS